MKRTLSCILAAVLLIGLISGCGKSALYRAADVKAAMYLASDADYEMAEDVAYSVAETSGTYASKAAGSNGIDLPQNRKWIINMSLSAETDDLDAALNAIGSQITAVGGYVENQQISNSSSYRKYRSASLSIRVPADQVDAFTSEISSFTNVTSSSRYVQDITLSYTDTEGRVNALKAEQQRLLELMEQAEKMSDLLDIEGRLTEVRYQLESYESQLRRYDNQVDFATVDLYVSEVKQYTPVEEQSFWQRIRDGLSDSIVELGETIVDAIVWFIVSLPQLLTLALIVTAVALITKRIIRKRKAKKAVNQAEKP